VHGGGVMAFRMQPHLPLHGSSAEKAVHERKMIEQVGLYAYGGSANQKAVGVGMVVAPTVKGKRVKRGFIWKLAGLEERISNKLQGGMGREVMREIGTDHHLGELC